MFYFVGILCGIGNISLPGCPQVLFLIKVKFKDISESYKSSVQRGESFYR